MFSLSLSLSLHFYFLIEGGSATVVYLGSRINIGSNLSQGNQTIWAKPTRINQLENVKRQRLHQKKRHRRLTQEAKTPNRQGMQKLSMA